MGNTEVKQRSRPRPVSKEECSICYENMYEYSSTWLPCSHVFHDKCINRWSQKCKQKKLPNTCPLCINEF
jgi:hypothetical protein